MSYSGAMSSSSAMGAFTCSRCQGERCFAVWPRFELLCLRCDGERDTVLLAHGGRWYLYTIRA